MRRAKIAVVGATGMVGRAFLRVLEEYGMQQYSYTLFASAKSAGEKLRFLGRDFEVRELREDSFSEGFDIALFSAGASVSERFAPIAAGSGAVVIDNSSRWRMDPEVPLVVPEVNPGDIELSRGIIANPNCSTIQAVVALAPLQREYGIERIVYTTFQAVSGAGRGGWEDLEAGVRDHLSGGHTPPKKFSQGIFGNCIPQIDLFQPDGYTKEEHKLMDETRKILHAPDMAITATAVRVPVFNSHSEAINVELKKDFSLEDIRRLLAESPGIELLDQPENGVYPLAREATGQDLVLVGRLRRDPSRENSLDMWVCADNIRKGAAANAVQIAEIILKNLREAGRA